MITLKKMKEFVPGVTTRQIQYWAKEGYIGGDYPSKGSGHPTLYTRDDVFATNALYHVSKALGSLPLDVEFTHLIVARAIFCWTDAKKDGVIVSWPFVRLDLIDEINEASEGTARSARGAR